MTSKEALEKLYYGIGSEKEYNESYMIIYKDLERLEILEKENQELKETLNKTRKMGLEIIEENKQLSNELHKLNCYRNIELNENIKLKNQILSLELDTCIPELRKENKELLVNKNVAQGIATKLKEENEKLKKVINYLELIFNLEVKEYHNLDKTNSYALIYRIGLEKYAISIDKEQYELLKEVL